MKNLIKDIEENCQDQSIEGIVKFLTLNGDIPYTSDHYREVWFFYLESLKMLKNKRKANDLTRTVMKVADRKLRRIKKHFENRTL